LDRPIAQYTNPINITELIRLRNNTEEQCYDGDDRYSSGIEKIKKARENNFSAQKVKVTRWLFLRGRYRKKGGRRAGASAAGRLGLYKEKNMKDLRGGDGDAGGRRDDARGTSREGLQVERTKEEGFRDDVGCAGGRRKDG
jgi:hypothetical protein